MLNTTANRLHLRLQWDGRRVTAVGIGGAPAPEAARTLEGKPVEAALNLVPLLFSAHPVAQGCAALSACEAALGRAPSRNQLAARRILLAAEILREHLSQLTLAWPERLHEGVRPLNLAGLRGHLQGIHQTIAPPEEWRRLDGEEPRVDYPRLREGLTALEAAVERTLFGMPSAEWTALPDLPALRRWALTTDTPIARTIDALLDLELAAIGGSDVPPLEATDGAALARAMEGEGFLHHPTWEGSPRESGPAARRRNGALVRALHERLGGGLLTRLTARLTEVPLLLRGLRALAEPGTDLIANGVLEGELITAGLGDGLGVAECAAGRLAHRVELQRGRIVRYRILHAERWNLHPEGALVRGLAGIQARDAKELKRDAALVVASLLPHLSHDLLIEERRPPLLR